MRARRTAAAEQQTPRLDDPLHVVALEVADALRPALTIADAGCGDPGVVAAGVRYSGGSTSRCRTSAASSMHSSS